MKSANDKIKAILHGTRSGRVYLCQKSIWFFALYYLTHYFTMRAAKFHKGMARELRFEGFSILFWKQFRGSAKTTWAKVKVLHAICYAYKKNIAWTCHDVKKAEKQVMSIASELKGNLKIIRDFGQLFWEAPDTKRDKSKIKTFSEFITSNGVYLKAHSTQISTRGDVIDQYRPDFYVLDDIENIKTAKSAIVTKSVIDFVDELLAGRAIDCEILLLCNKITSHGVVDHLEKKFAGLDRVRVNEQKLCEDLEGNGITWPSRYVKTKAEAKAINDKLGEKNKKKWVESVEGKKEELGTAVFKREFLNDPSDSEAAIIRREWIKREPMPDMARLDGVIAIDPAISEAESADFFAIGGVARHRETGKIYVFRSYKTRCTVLEQVNLVVAWHKLYPKWKVRIETVAYQKALSQLLSDKKREGLYIPIEDFKPDTDKVRRMQAIAPYIERGDIVFVEGREIDELIESVTSFPFAEHDDDADAMMSGIEHFVQAKPAPSLRSR